MLIPDQKKECLWCGRRLVEYKPEPWQTCVPRSDEHIIPKNIGGRIRTRDLCRLCNSRFGTVCDHALLNDKRIIQAAERVGFKFTDFRKTFVGTQKTQTGGVVPTRYRHGEFKPQPQLRPTADLSLPFDDWGKLRHQTGSSLIEKVSRKHLPGMDRARIASEVDNLLAAVDAHPYKEHWNEAIREGFRLTVSSGPVTVPVEMSPWETDWCLAKIVVELTNVMWPQAYQLYFRPAARIFRDFLEKLDHDPVSKSGKGIFEYSEVAGTAAKDHVIECTISPTKLEWQLTFFGMARWVWKANVKPIKAPPGKSWKIIVRNPLAGIDGSVECLPFEGGQPA